MTKEWVHDSRQEHLAAKYEALAGVDGVDQLAYREVGQRLAAWQPDVSSVRGKRDAAVEGALAVLVAAVDSAADELDPCVHVGSAAFGVVRALRDLGVVAS